MARAQKYLTTIAFLAFIGFVDASYLTAEHYLHQVLPCTITHGCEQVTTSIYATVAGVPVALLGALYYLIFLMGTFVATQTDKREIIFKFLAKFSWLGLLAAAYFTALQMFVLHAYCQYCLLSALTSTLMFVVAQQLPATLKEETTE